MPASRAATTGTRLPSTWVAASDLTGQGLGIAFLRAVLEFARQRCAADVYRVTIAGFNRRAIRMCQAAGFEETARFTAGPADEGCEFVVLTMPADRASPPGEHDRRHGRISVAGLQ